MIPPAATDASAALRKITLLDPNWLTGTIYTVLNSRQVADEGGEFSRELLEELLDPNMYPPDRHEFIELHLMQARG